MKRIGLSLITFILATGCLAAQPTPDLSGFWTLNVDASDDVEESLEDVGKIRSRKKAGKKGDSPIGSETYRRYWEHVADSRQWQAAADKAHGGSLRSLLFVKRLAIAALEGGYKVWYDDGFVRDINPNPYGRVFSASGDELVSDGIGRTLSYYKGARLILETRTRPIGKVMEKAELSADGQRLTIEIEVDRPDWKKVVVVRQVFDRVSDN